MNLYQINSLSKSYGKHKVINNLSFRLEDKKFHAILGANGSGKTTLIRLLLGLSSYDEGEILLENKNLNSYSRLELAKKISYVPQLSIIPNYTVEDFLELSRYPHKSPLKSLSKKDKEIIKFSMELTKISELKSRKMEQLSGGEKQRVIICSALIQDTKVIFLDEPETYLDPRYEEEIYQLMQKIIKEKSITIVFVTHNINLAMIYADSIICLKRGELLFQGDKQEFTTSKIINQVYDKEFHELEGGFFV